MADEDELYLANLDEFVNDEDKIVTYKWLSRTLSVPVNRAKQMLYAFVQKQKTLESASHLDITYVIGGRYLMDGDTVHRFVITRDEDLAETKKTFSVVTSLHIYSIQKCKLKDSNALYTVDYNIQQEDNSKDNRWSHIHCPSAKCFADKGAHRGKAATNKVNGVTRDDKKCSTTKMMNGDHGSSHTSKGPSTQGTEQKSKVSDTKPKKGQMSALEMFAAKPSTSKTEKKSNKKEDAEQDKDKKAAETKSDSNKAGSTKSFFGQNTTVTNVPEKSGTIEGEKGATVPKESETVIHGKKNQTVESSSNKKREFSSEDEEDPLPSKLSKAVKSDTKERKVSKEEKKKVQKKEEDKKTEKTKSSKTAKKKAVISESDEEPEEKPKKRRKRMKELPKEDSSDDEKIEKNSESEKKVSSDQGSTRSNSPLPQQQARQQTEQDTGRRRRRKRELKSKTYMNDEGFMVTEKVWESESTDASDVDDVQITTEPQMKEKHPSPAKKTNKKTHADLKNKGTKQASLTSFFKKS